MILVEHITIYIILIYKMYKREINELLEHGQLKQYEDWQSEAGLHTQYFKLKLFPNEV